MDVIFLAILAAGGLVAFACGYLIGTRFTVRALIVWSLLAGVSLLGAAPALGAGPLGTLLKTAVVLALVQAGYFVAAVTRPQAAEEEEEASQVKVKNASS